MDNNPDTLYSRLIAWLLEESVPPARTPVEGHLQNADPTGEQQAADFELEPLDPLDFEELNIAPYNTGEAARDRARAGSSDSPAREGVKPGEFPRPYDLGEIPTVENRFQALLKRRLQVEIERHPPLFPWETELSDYEPDPSDAVGDRWVPPVRLWMPQLANLSLPVSIPENVLAQLLDACSEAVYSRRKLGAKMVNAVENLFPERFLSLNDLAGRLLLRLSPARDGSSKQQLQFLETLRSLPYEDATPEQKMMQALLTAREIISALTVEISPTRTPVERRWQTAVGVVTVQAEYQMQDGVPKLRVIGHLPHGGSLTLRTPQTSATSQRTYPGCVSVESFDLQPNQTYPLEIRFYDSEQTPLVFAICPTM